MYTASLIYVLICHIVGLIIYIKRHKYRGTSVTDFVLLVLIPFTTVLQMIILYLVSLTGVNMDKRS